MRKFKSLLLSLALILIGSAGAVFAGCSKNNYSKVDFTLSDLSVTLIGKGTEKVITAEIQGTKNNMSKKIAFFSACPEVATVSESSLSGNKTTVRITAQGGGKTLIYAVAEGNVKKSIEVSVSEQATGIYIDPSYAPIIKKGKDFKFDELSTYILPFTASNTEINSIYLINKADGTLVAEFQRTINDEFVLFESKTKDLELGADKYEIQVVKNINFGGEPLTASVSVVVEE